MKSISKLALVVLLLAASYKMYGQTCSPQIQGCENDCQYALAACLQPCVDECEDSYISCQNYCDTFGEGSGVWSECIGGCNTEMTNCTAACANLYCPK